MMMKGNLLFSLFAVEVKDKCQYSDYTKFIKSHQEMR